MFFLFKVRVFKMNESDSSGSGFSVVLLFSVLAFLLLGAVKVYNMVGQSNIEGKWSGLKAKSIGHSVIVKAYRDCREKDFSRSVEECVLIAEGYADLKNYTKQFSGILLDIETLTAELSNVD
jgi:hypothetical protein